MSTDNYGYFGPAYSFADNVPLPGEIGVRQESSIGAILDAVGGINHYVDIIAFGQQTFMDGRPQQPMGIRHFLNTEMRCSNGATMSDYMDGIPRGDSVGKHVKDGLASAGLPALRGLAPGILENAEDALDPRPIFAAITSTGYPVCQKVACPVGDATGSVATAGLVDPVQYINGMPTQTRWVQAFDKSGQPIMVSSGEFGGQPKCYNADGSYNSEHPPTGCSPTEPPSPSGKFGSGKYGSCYLIQEPVVPTQLQTEVESFQNEFVTAAAGPYLFVSVVAIALLAFFV